jgi:hypothetical protein
MDSKYGYLAKKTNVKELNAEIQVKGRYPGYSLETAKGFDNKSIAYRNLDDVDCSIKPTLPVFEKVPMMQ